MDVKVNRQKTEFKDEDEIVKKIKVIGHINEKQKDRLLLIASKCLTNKLLAKSSIINSTIEME